MVDTWQPSSSARLGIPRDSIPEIISQYIVARIESGEISPGTFVHEKVLAEQLEVGRSSVRTALQRLQQSGLFVPQKGRGWRMQARPALPETPLDTSVWANPEKYFSASGQLLEVRMALEPTAVSLTAVRASASEIEGMASLGKAFAAAPQDDVDALIEADEAFHRALIQGAGNSIYTNLYDSLVKDIREFRKKSYDGDGIHARSVDDHGQIVYALRRRNSRLARQSMVSHLWTLYDEVRRADRVAYPETQLKAEGESIFG